MHDNPYLNPTLRFLKGGGEMGSLIRSYNWSENILGTPENWPQSLRTTISIILNSKFPMLLFWGPQYICFYNDAQKPSMGADRHPGFGKPAQEIWPEVWVELRGYLDQVLITGEATWNEDFLLPVYRNGKTEEAYWTYSHSLVIDENGDNAGVFVTTIETTKKVLAFKKLEEAHHADQELNERMEAMNEELAASNEEASATNEELLSANQELIETQHRLENALIKLENSESWFREMISSSPVAMMVNKGENLIIEEINDAMLSIIKKNRSIIGKPLFEVLPELLTQSVINNAYDTYQTGKENIISEEPVMLLFDGEAPYYGYFDVTFTPLKENGKITGIMQSAIDVTQQVVNRNNIKRISNQLKLAVESARIGTWHIDPETKHLTYNEMLANIFGYEETEHMTYDQAIGQVAKEYLDKIVEEIDKAINCGGDYDITYLQYRFSDDKPIWLRSLGKVSYDVEKDSTIFSGVVMDVTEQVNANLAIAESEERFRMMAEGSGILIAVGDETSNGTYFSKAWIELTGHSLNDLIKFGWADLVHPEDRENYLKTYLNAFKLNKPFSGEFRILNKNGEYRWLLATGNPRFQQDGVFTGYISSCIDITEKKQDEQRKNDFIGMVSHELKTPLTSIKGFTQILLSKAKKANDDFTIASLQKTDKHISKMTKMINGFLNISRLESGKIEIDKQPFQLSVLVDEIISELETQTSSQFIKQPCGDVILTADRDKIENVISNLLNNAIKYSPADSKVYIKCSKQGNEVVVSIKDEGMGIKLQDQEKLFDRYYRVEDQKNISGFGIGLYLSKEIIQSHNGKIWVESELGKGSTFYFSLTAN